MSIIIFQQKDIRYQHLNLHRVFKQDKRDPWLINLRDTQILHPVEDIFRLNKGFSAESMNSKSKQVLEFIEDVESNIRASKLSESSQKIFRNKVLHLSRSFVDKNNSHVNSIDEKIATSLKLFNYFLKQNSQIICTSADKGNITVIMEKTECVLR